MKTEPDGNNGIQSEQKPPWDTWGQV